MKALKNFGLIFGLVAGFFLLIALFLPSEIKYKESKTFHADPVSVFEEINTLKNWQHWTPWFKADPEISFEYKGPETGEGAEMHWKGPISGEGALEITESVPYRAITFVLRYYESELSRGEFVIKPVDEGTKVDLFIEMDSLSYPFERWSGILVPMTIEDDLKKTLLHMETFLLN